MTILSNRTFGGEIPRIPPDKLPPDKAQQAENCDFAYGELRPTRGTFFIRTMANSPKSIFSTDGLRFASWPYRTKAWKGPVTNDMFDRFYFTSSSGGLRVGQTSSLSLNGGEPASYAVGVPSVQLPLTYRLVHRTTLPDYPSAQVKLFSYYEADGKRYDEREITGFVTVTAFKEFTFSIAEPSSTVPAASAVSSTARTVTITRLNYTQTVSGGSGDGAYTFDQDTDVEFAGGRTATIVDSTTVSVGSTTYSRVNYIVPSTGVGVPPGSVLADAAALVGGAVPGTATPAVRIEVVDTAKNATIFSLSASSTTASSRSDAVPGGVEAQLLKNGSTAGAWKLVLDYGVIETRSYVVTLVNDWNEESKPSAPILVQPTYLDAVELTFTPASFTGYVPGSRFRVYRTVGSEYISCTPAPVTFSTPTTVFQDTLVNIADTDAVLESDGWDMPPTGVTGLTLLPNGFFAAFVGDTLYFSEPYRPWAWPYAMTFPVNLVGMRAVENSLVVTTLTNPYLVSGVHPDAMTQTPLAAAYAGVSDHGMCVVGNTVAYVSNDGLVVVRGFDADLTISQQFWTRDVWRQRFGTVLGQLELAFYDGAVICGCQTAGNMWELRLDSEGGGNLSMLGTLRSDALYMLPVSDQLYVVDGTSLLQYKGGGTAAYNWWSRDTILSRPVNFGAGYINTDASVTLSVYADGLLWHRQQFAAPGYFRVPSGSKKLRWSFRLEGVGRIKELTLAETMEELKNV